MTRREEIEAEIARRSKNLAALEAIPGARATWQIETAKLHRSFIRALNLELTNLGIAEAAEAMRVKP